MDAYQEYLTEIINSTYNEIKPLIDKLSAVGRCPDCNGHYLDTHCKYCGYEKIELKDIVDSIECKLNRFIEIISNLPIKTIPSNKLFNLLYTLKDIELTSAKQLLSKYRYDRFMIEIYQKGLLKVAKNESLSDNELEAIEIQIMRNDSTLNIEMLFCYFISKTIKRETKISYECFKELIKNYTEFKMKTYYSKPKCMIKSSKDMTMKLKERQTVGQAAHDKIWLSEEEVQAMYYEGSTALLNSMFHEIAHTMQYKQVFNGFNLNAYIIKEIKEHILTLMLEGYYEENYDYISYELEAEFYGITNAIQFLNNNGFSVDIQRHEKELNIIKTRMDSEKRYYNGEAVTIDILFEELISRYPELLYRHPQLQYLYKEEDDIVYPKSEEELINDYNMHIDDTSATPEDKEFYKKFYGYFLGIGGRK